MLGGEYRSHKTRGTPGCPSNHPLRSRPPNTLCSGEHLFIIEIAGVLNATYMKTALQMIHTSEPFSPRIKREGIIQSIPNHHSSPHKALRIIRGTKVAFPTKAEKY
jgi:hypothetical protein